VNADPTRPPRATGADPGETPDQPSQEELRAAYEAELRRVTSADMMLQAAVSLLNIGGHRLGIAGRGAGGPDADASQPGAGPQTDRDLEQVRDAIDAVRALLEILERRLPAELGPLRDALSQLQIAYAREVKVGVDAAEGAPAAGKPRAGAEDARGGDAPGAPSGPGDSSSQDPATDPSKRPGPAEQSGRLWVPGR
jgi:hypothetical protein